MTDKEKLEQISLSLEKFQRTGDAEHLEDIERILEYDGTDGCLNSTHSTPPEPPINVWDIDETEDRSYDEYDEWKDNVAMGYE